MKYIPDYKQFVNEGVNLKANHLSSDEYQKAKKLKAFDAADWSWNPKSQLYDKVNESLVTEAKFFRLPNKLDAMWELKNSVDYIVGKHTSGDDYNPAEMRTIEEFIKKIKKSAKSFKSKEEVEGTIYESVVNELRRDSLSGTMAGSIESLEDRKYELKKDVKGARIGDFINVTLPKGTIIYNLPGGVFADHFSLKNKYASKSSRGPQYFEKPTFSGISIRQMPDTLAAIEKNSKVLESVVTEAAKIETERYVRSHGKKPKGYGGWMFSYNRDGSDMWQLPNGMSWPDAQKWAKKKAKEDGEDYVYVMESESVTEAYKDKKDDKHKVKATVCYIKAMSGKRECKDIYFESKLDALGFKDNVKGFPKGAEVEAIEESVVTEGTMSDIHTLAGEAKDEADFIKKFFAVVDNPIKKSADNITWVKSLYKDINRPSVFRKK